MIPSQKRAERHMQDLEFVTSSTTSSWAAQILTDLKAVGSSADRTGMSPVGLGLNFRVIGEILRYPSVGAEAFHVSHYSRNSGIFCKFLCQNSGNFDSNEKLSGEILLLEFCCRVSDHCFLQHDGFRQDWQISKIFFFSRRWLFSSLSNNIFCYLPHCPSGMESNFSPLDVAAVMRSYRPAKRRAIFLDFGGTVQPSTKRNITYYAQATKVLFSLLFFSFSQHMRKRSTSLADMDIYVSWRCI